jgi:Fe2+ or Zn2+ uptake regulation protein
MAPGVAEIETRMRARGFALTPQRRAIVRLLVDRGGHWTATELVDGLTREFPLASRATVYSTLSLLRQLGMISELPSPAGELRFDANSEPHQHFVCRSCGLLRDVPTAWFPVTVGRDAAISFQVERFHILAEGLCNGCR